MFRKEFFFLPLAVIVLSGTSIAQSTTTAPSPTPATKRPMLDQFGLSTGVFANGSTASTANAKPVTKVEYVDQHIFETLIVLIEKSEFMEAELLRVLSDNVDITPSSRFRKYFEHHIGGLMNGSEVQRTGIFGGEGIKSGEITKLLQQNEKTIEEIFAVLDVGPAEYARFSKELNDVSEKYGVPLLESPSAGTRLDKPALLKAMMARMNSNYARFKKQMAVRK
ncbi:MAG: hypothetical protein WBD27_03235 [Pyrinomonadaceae bacterium]